MISWDEHQGQCVSIFDNPEAKQSLLSAHDSISNFCEIPTDTPARFTRKSTESITIAQKTNHVGYFDELVWTSPDGKIIDLSDQNFLVTFQAVQNRATLAIFPSGSEIPLTGEFRLLYKIRGNTIHVSTFIIEEETEKTKETPPIPEFSEDSPAVIA